MAKARNSVDAPAPADDPLTQIMRAMATPAGTQTSQNVSEAQRIVEQAKQKEPAAVLIEIPISLDLPPSEFGVHVDAHLSARQSTALRRIAMQLDRRQAVLQSGKRVVNATDAIKYLLELIATEAQV